MDHDKRVCIIIICFGLLVAMSMLKRSASVFVRMRVLERVESVSVDFIHSNVSIISTAVGLVLGCTKFQVFAITAYSFNRKLL